MANSKRAWLMRRAVGFTTVHIIESELPLYEKAKDFLDRLHTLWEFQMASDGTAYAVTDADWKNIKDAAKLRWPEQAKFIEAYPLSGSKGRLTAVERNLPDPPKGGVK
jgi:hypothetical protein